MVMGNENIMVVLIVKIEFFLGEIDVMVIEIDMIDLY